MWMRAFVGAFAALLAALALCAVSCQSDNQSDRVQATPALDRVSIVQDGVAMGVGRRVSVPSFEILNGPSVSPATAMQGRSGAVFVMTSVGCPVSTKYAPRVAAIEDEYSKRGVRFIYVNTAPTDTLEEMRRQIQKFGFEGSYAPDHEGRVAGALGARTTTEVFVFDPTWTLIYRGAVDDQFGVGLAVDAPKREFLRAALDALLGGGQPEIQATSAPGCLIDPPKPGESVAVPTDVTYFGNISKIVDDNCIDCHRPGGAAPFSLVGHESITGRAAMIEAVVRDGLMPPSHGAGNTLDSGSPRSLHAGLPPQDRAALLSWLASSRPLGTPSEASIIRPRPQGWAIGLPDLLVMTPRISLPADGPLRHERYLVPTNNDSDEWVSAIEVRPVKAGSVHHALVWLIPPGAVLPSPGEMPPSGGKVELLAAYSPGHDLVRYGPGLARRLPAGSILLMDVYARPMGIPADASLRVAMRFVRATRDGSATPREVRAAIVCAGMLDIAPGDAHAAGSAELVLGQETRLVALSPYMRARGRSMVLNAVLPDGTVKRLLDAPRFDYRWQLRYEFQEPLTLPAGTRLVAAAEYDNSAANANNPDPTVRVHGGSGAGDEALFVLVEFEGAAPGGAGAGTTR